MRAPAPHVQMLHVYQRQLLVSRQYINAQHGLDRMRIYPPSMVHMHTYFTCLRLHVTTSQGHIGNSDVTVGFALQRTSKCVTLKASMSAYCTMLINCIYSMLFKGGGKFVFEHHQYYQT